MTETKKRFFHRGEFILTFLAAGLLFGGIFGKIKIWQDQRQLFDSNVMIDGYPMAGKTLADAQKFFADKTLDKIPSSFTLTAGNAMVSSFSAELAARRDYTNTLQNGFAVGKEKPNALTFLDFWNFIPLKPQTQNFSSTIVFDNAALTNMIAILKKKADAPGQAPSATLAVSGSPKSLKIFPGKIGQVIDSDRTIINFAHEANGGTASISAVVMKNSLVLTADQIAAAQTRAKKLIGKQVTFSKDRFSETVNDQALISMLQLPDGYAENTIDDLVTGWAKNLNRPAQDPEFEYDPTTLKVKKFVPPQNGVTLDTQKLTEEIKTQLTALEADPQNASASAVTSADLPLTETPPTKSLADTNDLGINQQIGFGDSRYQHSIPGRIHNVALTAERVNNTIVKSGAEFSFVKTLGDVSAATGFQPAYIISGGRTVLGDGGGVCQVSSTVFRAVLNAGLPVTKRVAHSYRVSYYELNSKPGVDATVYAGDVDLRFINDTGHDILIHTETDSKNLYMDVQIYGTSDGRTTQIVDHKVWDITPAPPPLYQDDPTIPRGTIKQVDFAAAGAKASFTNVVKDKDGKIIRQDTYFSNYQPWRAIYLRGV